MILPDSAPDFGTLVTLVIFVRALAAIPLTIEICVLQSKYKL